MAAGRARRRRRQLVSYWIIGGVGITELGLVGILAAGADHRVSAQVTAAMLPYRAVTYLPPIPLGAIACLVWRHAPGLIHPSQARAGPAGPRRDDDAPQPVDVTT